jgi:hypothetical protein
MLNDNMAAKQRASFVAKALAAKKKMLKTGKGYDADEVYAYVKMRIAGDKSVKPKPIAWRS